MPGEVGLIEMKTRKKPETYEAVPWRMVFPGGPIPPEGGLLAKGAGTPVNLNRLGFQGVSTLPASLGKAASGDELLRECRRRLRDRDVPAFLDLLGMYPGLVCDRWVRETLVKLAKQRRLRRHRGRPTGWYRIYPLVVVALVEQLLSSGKVENPEQAFGELEELGVIPYASAKDLYYQALREERFRAILLTSPKLARMVTAEEVADRVRKAETLQPGGRITRTVQDSQLGSVSVTFEAK